MGGGALNTFLRCRLFLRIRHLFRFLGRFLLWAVQIYHKKRKWQTRAIFGERGVYMKIGYQDFKQMFADGRLMEIQKFRMMFPATFDKFLTEYKQEQKKSKEKLKSDSDSLKKSIIKTKTGGKNQHF